MKTSIRGQVIGIPVRSITYPLDQRSPKRDDESSVSNASSFKHAKLLETAGRLGPKITESVRSKLRLLQLGGVEKIFAQLFHVGQDEKLFKASKCYLSTSEGPIVGLLFNSSHKIAFCSHKSIKFFSPDGQLFRTRYKVVIPLSKVERVSQCENVNKPSQKYIDIVTVDNFDFWFMGFLNHKKALKCLQESLS